MMAALRSSSAFYKSFSLDESPSTDAYRSTKITDGTPLQHAEQQERHSHKIIVL